MNHQTLHQKPGRAALLGDDDEEPQAGTDDYPGEWVQGDQRFRLAYRFEPGADDDGVTVELPLALLARVEADGFSWLVPALREELVTALLKSLPKAIRKNVVPAADWARRFLPLLAEERAEGTRLRSAGEADASRSLEAALAILIRRETHTPTSPGDFELDRVPAHLRMTFAAIDDRGKRVGTSKDLGELQARFAERTRTSVAKATAASGPDRSLERSGITTWDMDAIPTVVESKVGTGTVRGYPALVDEGATGSTSGSVSIRVFATADGQQREHPRGVRRLLALALPSPLSYVQEHLTAAEKLLLASSPYRSPAALLDDALLAVLDTQLHGRAPFTLVEFEALRAEASAGLMDALFDLVGTVTKVLDSARAVDRAISAASSLSLIGPLADARSQLEALVHPGFVRATGVARMRRVPVYLAGILHRVEKLSDNLGRDRQWQTEVEQATELYLDAGGTLPLDPDADQRLAEVRWMLEELRLSLFAQHLGAAGPVSIQRIRKALAVVDS